MTFLLETMRAHADSEAIASDTAVMTYAKPAGARCGLAGSFRPRSSPPGRRGGYGRPLQCPDAFPAARLDAASHHHRAAVAGSAVASS